MYTELQQKVAALRSSVTLGCSGAHKSNSGAWLPCSSIGELMHTVFGEEVKSRITPEDIASWRSRRKRRGKRKRTRDNWEKLGQRGVMGIDTLQGGGLVSAVTGGSRPPITNGYSAPSGMSVKSIQQPYSPRDNDPDVFVDIESARKRSRQIGCIGVSRRLSKTGKTVWMPCTNMSDYARLTGSTALGRQHIANATRSVVRTVVREELKKRKKSISEELSIKALGPKIRGIARGAEPFDPNAIDGDEDGLVQDSTPFERPATPSAPQMPAERDASPEMVEAVRGWMSSSSVGERDELRGEPIEMFEQERGMASFRVDRSITPSRSRRRQKPAKPQRIEKLNNPDASPTNPFRNIGGRAMGQIIRGLVKPENRGKKDRTTYIIGGNIGSGKTTVLEGHLVPQGLVPGSEEAATIDPDFIKLGLPGYDDGAGAVMVHRDSQKSTDKTIADAASDGMDLVITGSGASRQGRHISEAKARGEKVVGHYVHVPQQEAARRIRARAGETGRQIDDNTSHMARSIPGMVARSINSGNMDEFYLWDNDVEEGSPPKLIASFSDGKLSVVDKEKFDEFMMGEKIGERDSDRGMRSSGSGILQSEIDKLYDVERAENSPRPDTADYETDIDKIIQRSIPTSQKELEDMLADNPFVSNSPSKIQELLDYIKELNGGKELDWERQKKFAEIFRKALEESPALRKILSITDVPPLLITDMEPARPPDQANFAGIISLILGKKAMPWSKDISGKPVRSGMFAMHLGIGIFPPGTESGTGVPWGAQTYSASYVIRHELGHAIHSMMMRINPESRKIMESEHRARLEREALWERQLKPLQDEVNRLTSRGAPATKEKKKLAEKRQKIGELRSRYYSEVNTESSAAKIGSYAASIFYEFVAEALARLTAPDSELSGPGAVEAVLDEHINALAQYLGMDPAELSKIMELMK